MSSTPQEVYGRYRIMPNLQLHQLRVAAVGKMVCGSFDAPLDTGDVILACLFHDMGNILKFDLGAFPEAVEPQGREYWEGVKREYAERYGTDQHAASVAIARELGLSERVAWYIDSIAFAKAPEIAAGDSWERKICEYADSRVAPHGVVPLRERLEDGHRRYQGRPASLGGSFARARFEQLLAAEEEIERQIFSRARLTPEEITDEAAAPLIEDLRKYPLP